MLADRYVLPPELATSDVVSEGLVLLPHYQPQSFGASEASVPLYSKEERERLRAEIVGKHASSSSSSSSSEAAGTETGLSLIHI